jgi:hypothetical protein
MDPAAWERLPMFGNNTLGQIAGPDPLIFRDTLGRVDSSDVFQGMKSFRDRGGIRYALGCVPNNAQQFGPTAVGRMKAQNIFILLTNGPQHSSFRNQRPFIARGPHRAWAGDAWSVARNDADSGGRIEADS